MEVWLPGGKGQSGKRYKADIQWGSGQEQSKKPSFHCPQKHWKLGVFVSRCQRALSVIGQGIALNYCPVSSPHSHICLCSTGLFSPLVRSLVHSIQTVVPLSSAAGLITHGPGESPWVMRTFWSGGKFQEFRAASQGLLKQARAHYRKGHIVYSPAPSLGTPF